MKYSLLSTLVLFICLTSKVEAQTEILGRWLSAEGNAQVEIFQEGDVFMGKIVWMEEPTDTDGSPKLDKENPDLDLRNTPILNLVILKDFQYKSDQWKGGTIYDPESGKTYNSKMWLSDNSTLKLRGYWGFLYRTSEWTRVGG